MSDFIAAFMSRPLWQRVTFWIGSLLILSYLLYQFLLKASFEEFSTLSAKVVNLNASITQEQRIARDLSKFRKEVKDLEVKLNFALQELPDQGEIDEFLGSISNLAKDAGLIVSLFKPQAESAQGFYAKKPVFISMEGTYHQLGAFFDTVGHLPRIVNIDSISIKEPKITEKGVTIKADCIATTFRYLDESERSKVAGGDDKKKRRKK